METLETIKETLGCPNCPKTYHTRSGLWKHKKRCHPHPLTRDYFEKNELPPNALWFEDWVELWKFEPRHILKLYSVGWEGYLTWFLRTEIERLERHTTLPLYMRCERKRLIWVHSKLIGGWMTDEDDIPDMIDDIIGIIQNRLTPVLDEWMLKNPDSTVGVDILTFWKNSVNTGLILSNLKGLICEK
jgi:hypothetical protein